MYCSIQTHSLGSHFSPGHVEIIVDEICSCLFAQCLSAIINPSLAVDKWMLIGVAINSYILWLSW